VTAEVEKLENRFKRFVSTITGAEFVDDVEMTAEQRRAKKVDFFFNERSILCEMKSLTTDVSPKVERVLEPHRERPEFPAFYGKWPITVILERLPDGKDIHKQLYDAVTSGIADLVADANRQIRQTKEAFSLPAARGILLILNDSIAILDPRLIAHRVFRTLIKRTSDGEIRYREIGAVWIIGETHRIQVNQQLIGVPGIIMAHPLLNDDEALTFLSELQTPWAQFARLPLIELPETAYDEFQYTDAAETSKPENVTLSELWRREYRDKPYLSQLTDDELVFYGARLSVEMTTIQKSSTATRHAILRSTRRWAEMNEELNRRRIDVWTVRRLAAAEGMHFNETGEFWEQTKLLADDCDVLIDI
jgi:hypothetical protein